MKDWASAADKIGQRSPQEVFSIIPNTEPFEFTASAYENSLAESVEDLYGDDLKTGNHLVSLPGRDILFISEALFSVAKFSHVLESARNNVARGAVTWALVDAHHATLLGARAIAAFYGVIVAKVRKRYVLMDFRPELGRVDHKSAFRKESRGISDPVRLLVPQKELIEQKETWALLARIFRISMSEDEQTVTLIDKISKFNLGEHKPKRNELLYNPGFWLWPRDIDLSAPPYDDVTAFLEGSSDERFADFEACHMVLSLVAILTQDFCSWIGLDGLSTFPSLRMAVQRNSVLS